VPKNSRLRIFAIGFLLKGCVISPVKRLTLSALHITNETWLQEVNPVTPPWDRRTVAW
jgi:hypothetical protein